MQDFYELLGIPRFTASQDEIKKAYRKQVMYFHPDKGHVSEDIALAKTKELNEAYDILSNPSKKAEYDEELAAFIKFGSQTDYDRAQKGYEAFNRIKPNYKYGQFYNSNQYQNSNNTSFKSNSTNTTSSNQSSAPYTQQKKKSGNVGCLIWIIIIIIGIIAMVSDGGGSSSSSSGSKTSTPSYSQPSQSYTPVSVSNGQSFKTPSGDCPCQISIKTSSGSNYYVYMEDQVGNNDLSFYIVGGNTVTKNIPLGTYKLYYCSGNTWYGTTHKFGDNTIACTSDDLFKFSSSISGNYIYYDTWEVTLYKVSNGNMSTENINISQFPD